MTQDEAENQESVPADEISTASDGREKRGPEETSSASSKDRELSSLEESDSVSADRVAEKKEELEARSDSAVQFLSVLSHCLEDTILKSSLRQTSSGLFVDLQGLTPLLDAYNQWLKENVPGSAGEAPDKLLHKLCLSDDPPLCYLIEGKLTRVGYLVSNLPPLPEQKIPQFQGGVLDAKDYFHLRDPILDELPDIKGVVDSRGFQIQMNTNKKGVFSITPPILTEFASVARNTKSVLKKYPELTRAYRNLLIPFFQGIIRAKKLPPKAPILIPGLMKKEKGLIAYRLGDSVFLSTKDNEIRCYYGLSGRNLHEFMIREYDAVKSLTKGRPVGDFQFPKKRGRSIGIMKVDGDRFFIEPLAFKEFVSLIPHAWQMKKTFNGYYTVMDCMKEFCKVFKNTKRAELRDLPKNCVPEKFRNLRFHVSESFVFVSNAKGAVISCLPKFSMKKGGGKKGKGEYSGAKSKSRTKKGSESRSVDNSKESASP